MSPESRRVAGILLILLPTVVIGGVSVLTLLVHDPAMPTTSFGRTCGGRGTPTRGCC
ncbi:MAG: hypothetical protein ACREK7_09260 [Gemmatimonadota bacterium]